MKNTTRCQTAGQLSPKDAPMIRLERTTPCPCGSRIDLARRGRTVAVWAHCGRGCEDVVVAILAMLNQGDRFERAPRARKVR